MIYDQFKFLQSDDYELFRGFSSLYASESCERSWANLMLYQDTYHWRYKIIDGRLWIASFEESYLFFPLGAFISPEELAAYWQQFARLTGNDAVIGDVPEEYLQRFPLAGEVLDLELDPGEADYIYSVEHLRSFAGGKLRKRHNQVRQFDREYENLWRVENITFEELDSIIDFSAEQSSEYWDSDTGMEEKLSFSRLKNVWQLPEAGLAGIALYIKDALVGFSIYSPLSNDLVDIHFEKADHAYRGCGAKLTAELVNHLSGKNYSFMNREQDLNSEGLRRAKQALDPDHLYKRLAVTAVK